MASLPTAALRCIVILATACTAGVCAAQAAITHPITTFDRAVAAGLPRTISLAASTERSRGKEGTNALVVESHLDIGVRFADGETGDMYLATWKGEQAVITRSGDHLDITVARRDGVSVTGFDREDDTPHVVESANGDNAKRVAMEHANRKVLSGRNTSEPRRPSVNKSPTLTFWMFLHDDTLGVDRKHIHASYVAWWIADMKKILPVHRLWAIYSQQVEGLTDMRYGHEESLRDWTTAIDFYERRNKLPRIPGKFEYKFMLVTSHEPLPGVTGQAWLGGEEAIASLSGRYTIIAHEYGHTLAATHEDAEVQWSSVWPCETNLISSTVALRSNCYRYSRKNERNIRVHMAREWSVPVNPDPPGIPLFCQ